MGQMFSGANGPQNTMPDSEQKPLSAGLGGLSQGLQSYGQQQAAIQQRGGGGGMPQMAAAQPVDPSYFAPGPNPMQPPPTKRGNGLPFYGEGN